MDNFLSLYTRIENPTFEMVLLTFLVAFVCASLIALTYYYTTPVTLKTSNYIQALILSAVIATMILQSIGDNVASGLGILGALTVINFRTSFRDPRDIIFMFATLGVGIACGSYVFPIALTGTLLFCALAFGLTLTPFDLGNHLIWTLRIGVASHVSLSQTEDILGKHCRKYHFEGFKNEKNKENTSQECTYTLVLKDEQARRALTDALEQLGVQVYRLQLQNNNEGLPIE